MIHNSLFPFPAAGYFAFEQQLFIVHHPHRRFCSFQRNARKRNLLIFCLKQESRRSVSRNAADCPDVSCYCFSFGKFYQNREIIVLAASEGSSSLCPAQAESVAAASSQCQNILKSVSSFLSSVLNCKTLTILLSLVLRLCFTFCNPLRSGYHSGYLVMAGKRN